MLTKIIKSLTEFDIEYKPAVIFCVILIGLYTGISSLEFLNSHEDCENFGYDFLPIGYCGDYGIRLNLLNEMQWNFDNIFENIRHPFSLGLVKLSYDITGDYRTFSLVSSVLLLFLVFFITRIVSKVNYISLLAVGLVISSPIFYRYDVILTYPNFWVTAILGSIYFGLRNSSASIVLFILSIPLKALTILFSPALIFFFKYSDVKRNTKISMYFICIAVVGIMIISYFFSDTVKGYLNFEFDPIDFLWWLGMWTVELQHDRFALILVMLSIMSLYLIRKVPYVKSILCLILFTLIQPAIIAGFTGFTNEEYRMLPLVIFASIGFCLMLVNSDKLIYEMQRFNAMFQK